MDKATVIRLIVELVAIVALFLVAVFVPKSVKGEVLESLPQPDQLLAYLSSWAFKLVVAAKNKMQESTGNEKFDHVSKELIKISEEMNIKLDEEMIKGLIEEAYDKMMKSINKEDK